MCFGPFAVMVFSQDPSPFQLQMRSMSCFPLSNTVVYMFDQRERLRVCVCVYVFPLVCVWSCFCLNICELSSNFFIIFYRLSTNTQKMWQTCSWQEANLWTPKAEHYAWQDLITMKLYSMFRLEFCQNLSCTNLVTENKVLCWFEECHHPVSANSRFFG